MALVSTLYQMTRKGMLPGASSFPEAHCRSSGARGQVLLWPSKATSETRCEGCLAVTSVTVISRTVWNDFAYFDGSGGSPLVSPKEETHSFSKVYKHYRGLALIFHYWFKTTLWMPAHGLLMASLMQSVLASGRINAPVQYERWVGWKIGG